MSGDYRCCGVYVLNNSLSLPPSRLLIPNRVCVVDSSVKIPGVPKVVFVHRPGDLQCVLLCSCNDPIMSVRACVSVERERERKVRNIG